MSSHDDQSEDEFESDLEELQDELEEKWKIKAFPTEVDLEDLKDEGDTNWKRCLVGKLLAQRWIEDSVIKEELHKSWKIKKDFEICSISTGYINLRFQSYRDMKWVETNGPWYVHGNIIILIKWKSNTLLKEYSFNKIRIWVQIKGLPVEKYTKEVLQRIGQGFGQVLHVDEQNLSDKKGKFGHFQVSFTIKSPLIKEVPVKLGGRVFTVKFKYEKLPIFNFFCGLIGHERRNCFDFHNHPLISSGECTTGKTP
ncbi:Cysteine desulfurase mitochondrial-like [Thalictrum thalictroides]|uniref:Cysteine desulfurase mitochondrial-like n=1 Tax=Thalictrum thalictroides TaxID=46969 RepID=A0A7J6W462_THATH|nr:Cysteine desulfurase mitochondrial-like [Thalictrum thalictroides]